MSAYLERLRVKYILSGPVVGYDPGLPSIKIMT